MKLLVCVKVVEGDGPEPICETRIATHPTVACQMLVELLGEEPDIEDWKNHDPFDLAQAISDRGCSFYVEEHEVQVVPMTEMEKCVVPGSYRIGDTPIEAFATKRQ